MPLNPSAARRSAQEHERADRGGWVVDPKGTGQTRWAVRWKPALNAFAITFADRMPTKTN